MAKILKFPNIKKQNLDFIASRYNAVYLLITTRNLTQAGQAPKVSPRRRLRTRPGRGRRVPARRGGGPDAGGRGHR